MKIFGETTVLIFASLSLRKDWQRFIKGGCSWDFPTFSPHVSIIYQKSDIDINKIKPFTGILEFGPEIFKEVDLKWKENKKDE